MHRLLVAALAVIAGGCASVPATRLNVPAPAAVEIRCEAEENMCSFIEHALRQQLRAVAAVSGGFTIRVSVFEGEEAYLETAYRRVVVRSTVARGGRELGSRIIVFLGPVSTPALEEHAAALLHLISSAALVGALP